jgi:hypothetical protein
MSRARAEPSIALVCYEHLTTRPLYRVTVQRGPHDGEITDQIDAVEVSRIFTLSPL